MNDCVAGVSGNITRPFMRGNLFYTRYYEYKSNVFMRDFQLFGVEPTVVLPAAI